MQYTAVPGGAAPVTKTDPEDLSKAPYTHTLPPSSPTVARVRSVTHAQCNARTV